MKKNKSSISKATSSREMEEFWDSHDLSHYWSKTRKVRLDVQIESEATYYAVESDLSEKLQTLAKKKVFLLFAIS